MRPLSSTFYVAALVVLGIIAFAGLGANMLERMNQVQEVALADHRRAAETELTRAVGTISREAERIAAELVDWDEVHQQLGDPTYYIYWRDQRLPTAGILPSYVTAIELYGPQGTALVEQHVASLPHRKPTMTDVAQITNGRLYYYHYSPIPPRDGSVSAAGYVGLKIDFLPALKRLNRFAYVDETTLALTNKTSMLIHAMDVPSLLGYQVTGVPASAALERLMRDTLVHFALLLAAAVLGFYAIIILLFSQPLRRLEKHIDALRRGAPHHRAPSWGIAPVAEIERLRESFNEYQEQLDQVHSRLDAQNAELWNMAHVDPLTGINNRRAFDEDWKQLQHFAENQRLGVAFLLFDCDFFKAINDTYGHHVGDQVIEAMGKALSASLRKGDKLYRLGGDEFAAVLINATSDDARLIAHRCLEAIRRHPFRELGIEEAIKIGVGLSHSEGTDPVNLADLPRQADVAMYQAKHVGTDKLVQYTHAIDKEAGSVVSNRAVNAVVQALETGQGLEMHYQCVVRTDTLEVDYYEALVRIRDKKGVISPADIFPIITRRSLDKELDLAVLRQVCRDLQMGAIPPGTGVSINLSGTTLALPEFCHYMEPLREFVHTTKLLIEVTETAFISQLQQVSKNLTKLRECGFKVALDDFGSGYSSIRYLTRMPIDTVKFDISMLEHLHGDSSSRAVIEGTARLVRDAGYALVAEGIETEQVKERVIAMGATHVQGFLLGRPKPLPLPNQADQLIPATVPGH